LSDKDLTAKSRLNLDAMLTAGAEILNKINNSFDLFKMQTGRYPFSPTTVELVAMINSIVSRLHTHAETKK